MKILALDVGTKTIGMAVSDPMEMIATPVGCYKRKSLKKDLEFFDEYIKKNKIEKVIVGYPLYLDGKESKMTKFVRKFYYKIKDRWGIPVELWDERLTTEEAIEILKERNIKDYKKIKEKKDEISAALILRSYLEAKNSNSI